MLHGVLPTNTMQKLRDKGSLNPAADGMLTPSRGGTLRPY